MVKEETEELRAKESRPSAEIGVGIDPATELPPPDETLAEAAGQGLAGDPTEIDRLKAERDQLLDRLARMQAEFENARKRAEREKLDFRDHATGNVVEQFLPVLDNFELALKSAGSAEQLRSGVSLIVKQMEEILEKMQVRAVPAIGEVFDPRVHEALGTVERDDMPDQHVAEEIRRGYKIRERLLRPALVRVAHNAKQVNE
ncbi:MAG: nucleotide exchange factor GrpE [Terracidiphilus sp.]|jgi:molecular chaperone GrpE